MLDTYKHKGSRKRLVEQLKSKGISHEALLDAIGKIPRHYFVDSVLEDEAYEDKALPIASYQTISQPFTVAYQTELLDPFPKMKVLEIGTGSGYQAAILCEMGCRLFTVEMDPLLHREAKQRLADLGFQPKMYCGDGSQGWKRYQPYDGIIVTAGGPDVPLVMKEQLEIGGRLVMPVGDLDQQFMTLVIRKSKQEYEIRKYHPFKFVPLRGRFGHENADEFFNK